MLPEEEAHHAARVLRVSAGDEIVVVDGMGGWHRVVVDHVDRRSVAGHVVERRQGVGEPPYELTIALGLLKQRSRFEVFLEKAVELGVHEVVPLVTERTERERVKETRLQNILVAAMKQSLRSRLVELHEPTPLDELLALPAGTAGLICHEAVEPEASIRRALERSAEAMRLRVLVGPEGGFTDGEVEQARRSGYEVVSLGPRRLRAETAALTVAAIVLSAKNL